MDKKKKCFFLCPLIILISLSVVSCKMQKQVATECLVIEETENSFICESSNITTDTSTQEDVESCIGIMHTLDKDCGYAYDLNCDGNKEKVNYTYNDCDFHLYINGQLCQSYTNSKERLHIQVYAIDFDTVDESIELVSFGTYSNDTKCAFFQIARYDQGDYTILATQDSSEFELSWGSFNPVGIVLLSNNNFQLLVSNPNLKFKQLLGTYECYVPFKFENGKINNIPSSQYELYLDSVNIDDYILGEEVTVYNEANRIHDVFSLQEGDRILPISISLTDPSLETVTVYIESKDGRTGYIQLDHESTLSTKYYIE